MGIRVAVIDPHRVSRSEPLVRLLRARVDLVGDPVIPHEGRLFDIVNKARAFHPVRDTWRARAFFNAARWNVRSADASRQLRGLPGHDARLHIYPISCSLPQDRPYVVLTDNTMAVTQRSFKRWANLSAASAAAATARERDVMRSAAFIATYSTQARESMIDDYGCDPDRVVRVDGGVGLDIPEERPRTDRKEALFVATSFWRKGGKTLLAAWNEVERVLPEARLTIAGPAHRAPADLPPSVTWLGRQSREQLRELYERANVFVLPTLFESSVPNVIREAMTFGLPVVASDVPGIALDASPEVTLVPTEDAPALATSLLGLLADPRKATDLGRRSREAAIVRYSFARLADEVAALLERAAAAPQTTP